MTEAARGDPRGFLLSKGVMHAAPRSLQITRG
jgi:hypothetical protein